MNVGRATLNDLPSILAYSREAFDASITYQATGYNEVIWRNTLKAAFADPTMVVLTARKAGKVCGLLVGMKMPMPWSAGFCACDLVFVASQGGDRLLRQFVLWCKQQRVARIDMGVSDIQKDGRVMDELFKRAGFSGAGRVYYRIEGSP